MSDLDFQQTCKELRQWRAVPEHAQVIDTFCARLARQRELDAIAREVREAWSDRKAA